jgi:CubicO group peptidase (beta-lactamase class C family)
MKTLIFSIALFSLILVSCQIDSSGQYSYEPPEKIDDGLQVGTLEEVNIKVGPIEDAVNLIQNGRIKEVHSILIYKDDKLVFEEYFQGHKWLWDAPAHHGELVNWDRSMIHNIMSATKSVTSACIGIAIGKGLIESVDQSIFDYLPDHQHLRSNDKEQITIEHLLTMRSGLAWREWSAPYSSTENPTIGVWFQDKDPISFILEMPFGNEPGTKFNYSSGNIIVLGEIIRNASGMSIDDFSEQYMFKPMEVDTSHWAVKYDNGVDANNLLITSRAMIKFGVMYLNNGAWNGNQIIPADWVGKSANTFPGNTGINIPGEDSGRNGYSYTWWTNTLYKSGKRINMYSASGFGGQHIMVLPELNMVVVFTGGNFVTKRPPFKILKKYIIPAVR